jgi:protein involved in polysaccharide export with SLBB domain
LVPQPLAGSFLVRPDGTVNLGVYGAVRVAGLTLEQAKDLIVAKLKLRLKERKELDEQGKETGKTIPLEDEVVVDIEEYASKYCYLIADGGGFGASVVRIPINGSDTVLDAISKVGGLPQ